MPEQSIPNLDNKPIVTNPLANYFRQPKLFIRLPSHGEYYPEGSLDRSQNDEYAVYAMTARDELMFKTPDALMNGQATVEVIKSCIPAIKNPWLMPSMDLDSALIAIRIASYGESMEVATNCPACNYRNEYNLDLLRYLDQASEFQYQDKVEVDGLIINLRPYNYKEITQAAIKTFEQQKLIAVVTDENLTEEEKVQKFGEGFVRLTELTVDVVVKCIASIETPAGIVTDQAMIQEFMENTSSSIFNTVNDRITEMKDLMSLKAQNVQCAECEHEFNVELTMDQTNFFGVGS